MPPRACRTDGCTLVPDLNFRDCCVKHDEEYWFGGDKADRKQADVALRQCMVDHGHPQLGTTYFHGVRAGGVPWLPTPWRWGFGWPYGRGYAPSQTEKQSPSEAKQSDEPPAAPSAQKNAD